MPKETSPARRSVAKYLPKDSASPEDHRGRWQVGRDREIDAPDETADDSQQAVEDDGKEHGELYRAGKIDAYMRYLKMQPPAREAEPVTLRQSATTRERPAYRFFDQEEEPREVRYHGYQQRAIRHPSPRGAHLSARRPQRRTGTEIAIAVTLSLAAAGVTGLIVYDRTSGGTLAQSFATRLSGLSGGTAAPTAPLPVATVKPAPITLAVAEPAPSPSPAPIPPQAPASKKPVAIAQLEVEDASGSASSPIPLALRADPAIPGQNLALRLSGLPENASLTAGTRVGNDAWMLRPGEERGVKLMVPSSQPSQFSITVEAIEPRTGDLAAPVKEITVSLAPGPVADIQPAAAPASVTRNFNLPEATPGSTAVPQAEPAVALPEARPNPPQALKPDSAMPIPAPIEKTSLGKPDAALGLLHSGDKLMDLGEISAARQFYAKALDGGAAEAAFRLGQTFDPAIFAEKNVQGLKPDPSLAMKYYLQAQASGVTQATQAIASLEAWMKQ
jgi:hypothetical protein